MANGVCMSRPYGRLAALPSGSGRVVLVLADGLGRGASSLRTSRAGADEPRFVGEHDGLDAVTQVELAEHARDVGLDGRPLRNSTRQLGIESRREQ